MKTLITGAVILTCDEQLSVLEHADLVMDGGRISFVGERYEGDLKNGDILTVDEEAARRALQKAALELAERTGAVPA